MYGISIKSKHGEATRIPLSDKNPSRAGLKFCEFHEQVLLLQWVDRMCQRGATFSTLASRGTIGSSPTPQRHLYYEIDRALLI
ncbi:MAG TPA: hypothetical protein VMY18_05020, partial [Acidobacteriota bacterium]|nr:hypothetical protein [Acidobacteriota bacterium]